MAASLRMPGLVLTEHELEVPLDHDGSRILDRLIDLDRGRA